jgi:hypothetical protein
LYDKKGYPARMKTADCVTFLLLLIATALGSIGATALSAQEYVRDSEPKAFDRKEYGMNNGIPFIKIADRVEVSVYLKGQRASPPRLALK